MIQPLRQYEHQNSQFKYNLYNGILKCLTLAEGKTTTRAGIPIESSVRSQLCFAICLGTAKGYAISLQFEFFPRMRKMVSSAGPLSIRGKAAEHARRVSGAL